MRHPWLCCLTLLAVASYAPAQEAVAKSKIVSVGLFKNGLAVVKREVQIDKAGTYLVRVESDNSDTDHEHFSAIDLVVE